jgi:hypothetical protein
MRGVQMLRYIILVADLMATVLLPLAINYSSRHARSFIDYMTT